MRRVLAVLRSLPWADAAQGGAILVGIGGVVLAVARLTGRPDVVWPLGVGLFLLSLAGWGFLRRLFTDGLYHHSLAEEERPTREGSNLTVARGKRSA